VEDEGEAKEEGRRFEDSDDSSRAGGKKEKEP